MMYDTKNLLDENVISDHCYLKSKESHETYLIRSFYEYIHTMKNKMQVYEVFEKDDIGIQKDLVFKVSTATWEDEYIDGYGGIRLPQKYVINTGTEEGFSLKKYNEETNKRFTMHINLLIKITQTYILNLRKLWKQKPVVEIEPAASPSSNTKYSFGFYVSTIFGVSVLAGMIIKRRDVESAYKAFFAISIKDDALRHSSILQYNP